MCPRQSLIKKWNILNTSDTDQFVMLINFVQGLTQVETGEQTFIVFIKPLVPEFFLQFQLILVHPYWGQ